MTYTPAETVQRSGFTIETLRYYERIGLLADIQRDAGGHRMFSDADLEWLEVLKCLRDTGMPIAAMRRYAELALNDGSLEERMHTLADHDEAVSQQIELLHQQQRHLRDKIAYYEGLLEIERSVQEEAQTSGAGAMTDEPQISGQVGGSW
ncbi:MerR family transcriptional regulator [Nakamurella lactea]|uniref:MerR family transcriptional regulator n=1 Tax=Nakamurella lactea TaxID=459515 RepID=UPI000413AB03|nr:MerR family transcriptional regulator [Nakamurella lactea]